MFLTVLGYGSIPGLLAFVIGLSLLFSSVRTSSTVPEPYQREFLGRGILISIGGLLLYFICLIVLALDPDTLPVLHQIIQVISSAVKNLYSYIVSQSIETLILWGFVIVLLFVVGYYLGSQK